MFNYSAFFLHPILVYWDLPMFVQRTTVDHGSQLAEINASLLVQKPKEWNYMKKPLGIMVNVEPREVPRPKTLRAPRFNAMRYVLFAHWVLSCSLHSTTVGYTEKKLYVYICAMKIKLPVVPASARKLLWWPHYRLTESIQSISVDLHTALH